MTPPPQLELPDIQPMMYGLIFAWLAEDYWAIARIQEALAKTGATPGQVAETATLAAASLLAETLGAAALAAPIAERRWQSDTARHARLITGRREQQERTAWAR
jgi:hypothetical protein